MKDKVLIFFVVLLSCIPALLRGQEAGQEGVSTKIVPYIVIKGDKLKNIAVRFQVPARALKKLNKISSNNYTVYPGLILKVPVKVRERIWDPAKDDISDAGLLSQDRLPSVDYEIIGEGFDYDIRDDFIAVSDAVDDSVQYERIGVHMRKIEKKVSQLSYRMDSLKQAEFALQYSDTDINSVLGKMQMARENYYINGPVGRQIDSLNRLKAKLGNLRIRLRNKKTEYEYLMDNAAYARENYEREEKNKDTHWGDQITYESNYARSMAKHKQLIPEDTIAKARADSIRQSVRPIAKDTVIAVPMVATPVMKDTIPVTSAPAAVIPPVPAVKDTMQAPAPVAIANKDGVPTAKPVAIAKDTTPPAKPVTIVAPPVKETPNPITVVPVAKETATASAPAASPGRSPFGLNQKVDIFPLIVRHTTVVIPSVYQKPELVLLPTVTRMDTAATKSAIAAAPVVNDTAPKQIATTTPAPLVKDTSSAQALVKNTVVNNTATAPAIKDTAVPARATKSVSPTTDTSRQVSLKTDTTTPKPVTVITVHDTVFLKTADTTGKAHIAAAPMVKDTTSKTINPLPAKATDSTSRAAMPAAHARDTTRQVKIPVIPIRQPEAAKPRPVAEPIAPTAVIDTAEEDASVKATREREAKAAKEVSHKTDRSKGPGKDKDTDSESADAAKPVIARVDTPAPPVVVRVKAKDISKGKEEVPTEAGPYITLDTKYDSTMLYREKVISTDPLSSYKTDSNFITSSVQLKEIPILEYKNKPKYLIPVDSVSQIKAEFYLIRARQVLEKGDFKEGDKYLRKSLELNPNSAATWMLHADLCLTMGAVDKALKEYNISGEIDSTNPKVFYNIALLYSKANDEQKAYKFFSKATDVNDKYLLAYMGRATVLMDQRDYEGAIQDYDKTLSINKYYSPAYKGRALAKMEAHRFEDAVVDFNQFLEIEDPDGYVLYQRGIAKILSNNLLQGCLDLSSSLELGFKDAEKAIKKFCE